MAMEEEEEEEEAEGWQEKEVVVVMKDISGAHREIRLCLLDEYESEELGTSHCANHRSGEASSFCEIHLFISILK